MYLFAFDPSAPMGVADDGFGFPGGPGYVWHCHIVDHEDNEMMRQFQFVHAAPLAAGARAQTEALAPPAAILALGKPLPNPTTGATRIGFTLPRTGNVELAVFDLAGRMVSRLATGRFAAGEHSVQWAGTDEAGRPLPSGTYLYRLRTEDAQQVRRLALIR